MDSFLIVLSWVRGRSVVFTFLVTHIHLYSSTEESNIPVHLGSCDGAPSVPSELIMLNPMTGIKAAALCGLCATVVLSVVLSRFQMYLCKV